ncbi:universal stress protein [Streptomyces sp. UNOB3_S3]|uniref:universal stress protein n=1 Tax=Streptomyces sp. UNOB3_S3 TaxID=2871682 RepID=UPI001E3594BC|nr:universal stress protein [Streptomyces sp. UNOB3_S3]MCC3775316.1 universal stress protein [Streptomyces sp. UNOB3_S3]
MNRTVRRVVVGVDGSAGSLAALRKAAEEARRHHATLRPVLVYSSPMGDYIDLLWPPDPRTARELDHTAYRRLVDSCERALGGLPADVRCAPTTALGPPAPLLVQASGEDGDVLVVGSGGHGALHRLLKGSVSRYCLRHCDCPVMVVPPPNDEISSSSDTAHPSPRTTSASSARTRRPCRRR